MITVLALALALSFVRSGHVGRQLQEVDFSRFKYEDFSPEDIWKSNLTENQGCIKLNTTYYREHIFDKPESNWFVSIVSPPHPRFENKYSTIMMQTLYFLKKEMPELNCAFILKDDEVLREVFENQGLPQSLYIVGGITYYMDNVYLGINHVLEFLQRYEELAV
jgi:hypothetical protein